MQDLPCKLPAGHMSDLFSSSYELPKQTAVLLDYNLKRKTKYTKQSTLHKKNITLDNFQDGTTSEEITVLGTKINTTISNKIGEETNLGNSIFHKSFNLSKFQSNQMEQKSIYQRLEADTDTAVAGNLKIPRVYLTFSNAALLISGPCVEIKS